MQCALSPCVPLGAPASFHSPNTCRLTGDRRCECEREWLLVSVCQPCDELETCAGESRPHPVSAGIGLSPHVTLRKGKQLWIMNDMQGWEGYFGNVIGYRLLVTLFKM